MCMRGVWSCVCGRAAYVCCCFHCFLSYRGLGYTEKISLISSVPGPLMGENVPITNLIST